jgi:hypothetical protein
MADLAQDYLTIKDTTPRATERNNLTIKAPRGILTSVAEEAKRQGVDPYAALAMAWKETLFGTKSFSGTPKQASLDPLQWDFQNISRDPRVDELVDQRVNQMAMKDPEWGKAKTPEERNRIVERHSLNFANQGGISYFKDMLKKHQGNLEQAFGNYRGVGPGARYHGKHVMELYNALKGNPDLKQIIEGKQIESRQEGGLVQKDKPYLVGEEGPETFIPKQSGYIKPYKGGLTMPDDEKIGKKKRIPGDPIGEIALNTPNYPPNSINTMADYINNYHNPGQIHPAFRIPTTAEVYRGGLRMADTAQEWLDKTSVPSIPGAINKAAKKLDVVPGLNPPITPAKGLAVTGGGVKTDPPLPVPQNANIAPDTGVHVETGPEMAKRLSLQNPEIRGEGSFAMAYYKDPKTGKIINWKRPAAQGLTHPVPKDEVAGAAVNQRRLNSPNIAGDNANVLTINGEEATTTNYGGGGPRYFDETPFPQYGATRYLGTPKAAENPVVNQLNLEDMKLTEAANTARETQAAETARSREAQAAETGREQIRSGPYGYLTLAAQARGEKYRMDDELKMRDLYQKGLLSGSIPPDTPFEDFQAEITNTMEGKEVPVTQSKIQELLKYSKGLKTAEEGRKWLASLPKDQYEAFKKYSQSQGE